MDQYSIEIDYELSDGTKCVIRRHKDKLRQDSIWIDDPNGEYIMASYSIAQNKWKWDWGRRVLNDDRIKQELIDVVKRIHKLTPIL